VPPALRQSVRSAPSRLESLDDATLLDTRLCDLPIKLEGTLLARRVARLWRELQRHGIAALPHAWLSEEFFTPDGVLGFAIPFYLAHPRLMRLERTQMLEVEGAGEAESRRIFRHEAGHCLDEAYAFHRRARYRELFGDARLDYPSAYTPKPDSRDHVINLAGWYAQGHPVEDFAETFAVIGEHHHHGVPLVAGRLQGFQHASDLRVGERDLSIVGAAGEPLAVG